jgi:hypothetical protein
VNRLQPRVLLALGCTLLCAALLAACGGSGDKTAPEASSAQRTLERTFGARATSIRRARIAGEVRLDPEGLLKVGGPIALHVEGPFAAPSGHRPARFGLAFVATLGGDRFKGTAISTGARSFLRLDDTTYALDAGRRSAKAAPKSHPGLKALGIDPLHWISNVEDRGSAKVGGVDTTRLQGDVDTRALLSDVGRLLDMAGGGAGGFLTPALVTEIGKAVKSARVDVWTGADDDILRQIAVDVRFAFKASQSPIVGLDGGRLRLRLRLDDVNGAPVRIATPAASRPLAQLTGPGGLGAVLAGLGTGLTGGIAGGAIDLVSCVTGAAGSSVELVRCVAKLAP